MACGIHYPRYDSTGYIPGIRLENIQQVNKHYIRKNPQGEDECHTLGILIKLYSTDSNGLINNKQVSDKIYSCVYQRIYSLETI